MKTNQELLDFYGVEPGKKYKIINPCRQLIGWIGSKFVINGDPFVTEITDSVGNVYHRDINFLANISYEEVKELLTDEEKDYLKTVIKPFRDRIQRIYKTEAGNFYEGGEVLFFELKLNDYFYLPELPLNKMFSGMEQDKKYTLEELGI